MHAPPTRSYAAIAFTSRSGPSSWGGAIRIGIPLLMSELTRKPRPSKYRRIISSYSCASVGTTAATMTPSTSLKWRPRRSSRVATWVASSSAVANRAVWKRQCSTSSSPRNMPTWVCVLPTSMASSTPRSLRPERRAHRVEAAVHVQDLAGDATTEVRQQEQHGVGDRAGVERVPAERRLLLPQAGERLEPRDALGGRRLDRAGGDEVHADVLLAQVARQVAVHRLERGLRHAHPVVDGPRLRRVEVHAHQAAAALHQREKRLGERLEGVRAGAE